MANSQMFTRGYDRSGDRMLDDSFFSEIIQTTIEAPLDENRWTKIADMMASRYRGHAVFYTFDVPLMDTGQIWFSNGYNKCLDLVDAFLDNQSAHEIAANEYIARSKPFTILTELDVFYATQDDDIPPMPFRDQLHAQLGTGARIGAKLNDVGPWVDVGALHIPGKNSEIREQIRSELMFLYPIFGKAIETGRIVANLTGKYGAILSLFDRLTFGVAFVDDSGKILLSNKCFNELARDGDGFKTDGKSRPVSVLGDESILLDICDTAQNDASGGQSLVALLERRSGQRPLIAKASKIRNTDVANDSLVLMLVVDPEAAPASDFSELAALGRLTGAEIEICRLLLQGLDTENIANLRDTTVATTRTQFKVAQAKLGCHSRLDLLRLVLATSTSISSSHTPDGV